MMSCFVKRASALTSVRVAGSAKSCKRPLCNRKPPCKFLIRRVLALRSMRASSAIERSVISPCLVISTTVARVLGLKRGFHKARTVCTGTSPRLEPSSTMRNLEGSSVLFVRPPLLDDRVGEVICEGSSSFASAPSSYGRIVIVLSIPDSFLGSKSMAAAICNCSSLPFNVNVRR